MAQTTILVLGDSLSSGYGIEPTANWVNLLKNKLNKQNYDVQIINSSISGETTGGGENRACKELTTHKPEILVIALGSNDGLRGYPPKNIKSNLEKIIKAGLNKNINIILVGFLLPTNYGPKYRDKFENIYQELNTEYKVTYVPFILKDIALDDKLMQDDRYHPNEKAQPLMLEIIWPYIVNVLENMKQYKG